MIQDIKRWKEYSLLDNDLKKELNDNTIKNNWWQNIKQKIKKEKAIEEHKCISIEG